MEITFDVRALPAGEAVRLYVTALSKMFANTQVHSVRLTTNATEKEIFGQNKPASQAAADGAIHAIIEKLEANSQYMKVKRIFTHIAIPNGHFNFEYVTNDWVTARVQIVPPHINNNQAHQVGSEFINQHGEPWVEALSTVYDLTTRQELVASLLPQVEQDKIKYQQQTVLDLTAVLIKLEHTAAEQVNRQSEYLNKRNQELDEQQAKRDEERRKSYELKLQELDAERAALVKEKAEIDLRRSTIARRALLTDLTQLLDLSFEVKEPTLKLRSYNLVACVIGIVAGIGLLITGSIKLFGAEKMEWHYWSIFIAGSLLFGSTLVYYLRWNDSWFRKLAESEFFNRKLKIDALRSSWIAEMVLEWSDEKGGKEFPSQLLTSFSTGLFQTGEEKETEHHPIGQLLRTVGKLESLKVTKDGVELKQKEK